MRLPVLAAGINRIDVGGARPAVRAAQLGVGLGRDIPADVPHAFRDCHTLLEECRPCTRRVVPGRIRWMEWWHGVREVTYCFDQRFGGFTVLYGPCLDRPCSPFQPAGNVPIVAVPILQ